jgi:hypothetical protein
MIDNAILRVLITCLLFRPPAPPRPRNVVNPNSPNGSADASQLAASTAQSSPSVAGMPQLFRFTVENSRLGPIGKSDRRSIRLGD